MPTIMTHAAVGLAVSAVGLSKPRPRLIGPIAAGLAMLPDVDVVAFALRIPWESMWSHRAITHSLAAALITAVAVTLIAYRRAAVSPMRIGGCLFTAMASHGVLDAFTSGGPGVAFFAPFDSTRHFWPWRPVLVSPIGLGFFSEWGLRVMVSEICWIWLPAAAVVGFAELVRRSRRRTEQLSRGTRGYRRDD